MSASPLVIEGCAVATVDPAGGASASGHRVIDGDRIVAFGNGRAPEEYRSDSALRIDGGGWLATSAAAPGTRRSWTRFASRRRG